MGTFPSSLARSGRRTAPHRRTWVASVDIVCCRFLAEGDRRACLSGREILTGRQVALKLIKPAHAEDESSRQRLLREAQLAAQIDHNVA